MIVGWMVIGPNDYHQPLPRLVTLRSPGYGGEPLHVRLKLRPFLAPLMTMTIPRSPFENEHQVLGTYTAGHRRPRPPEVQNFAAAEKAE